MAYQVEVDLKLRARKCRVTVVQLASVLGMPPPTLSNKLNGFSQLDSDTRRAIERFLSEKERALAPAAVESLGVQVS